MTLDLRLVGIAGFIWGVIAAVLVLLTTLFGSYLPLTVDGLSLGTYAMMFAGVHFVVRNGAKSNIIVSLIGGMLAGLIAAVILLAASFFIPGIGARALDPGTILGALGAGIAGALGMIVVGGTSKAAA